MTVYRMIVRMAEFEEKNNRILDKYPQYVYNLIGGILWLKI